MRPEWLWCMLPAALLTVLLWRQRSRSGSWSDVISDQLLPFLVSAQKASRGPNLLPGVLAAWMLAVLAASGPSWKQIPLPLLQKQDALILVLDLSYSMKAGDMSPSRLDHARRKLLDLLDQRNEGQTGLIAYAGDSHIVTPLTDDNPTIANLLPALSPDMMPLAGSDSPAAINQAIELLRSAGIREGRILLVTDGVSENNGHLLRNALEGTGIDLAILGVGTRSGAPIPLSGGGFLKDQDGAIVIPSLDETDLQALASSAGGHYHRIQIDNSDLDQLLTDPAIAGDQQTQTLDRTADTWEDQGYLLALVLLPLGLALFRPGILLCLIPLLVLTNSEQATADVWDDLWLTADQQGQKALARGDNEAAANLFENTDWAGTAAYNNDNFEDASSHFSSTKTANSWYNRGNALARQGQYDEAIAAYNESLTLAPEHQDAIDNVALLEQLKQQQEQSEGDQQNQDQSEDQDQQSEQSEQGENKQSDPQQQSGSDQSENNSDQQPDQDPEDQSETADQDSESEQQDDEQAPQDQPSAGEEEHPPQSAEAATPSDEDMERDQAMQQWLRRVPDDPSGLLREKFRYESRQRQGYRRDDEPTW
ncbi:MAG: VWA domain-containing protein [Halieaceae bacterium]|nr:VWA domain-containing protein [Halieaceae bacterium]